MMILKIKNIFLYLKASYTVVLLGFIYINCNCFYFLNYFKIKSKERKLTLVGVC